MKQLLTIVLFFFALNTNAQHSFFRGNNNYVAPTAVATSQANALNFSTNLQNYASLPSGTYFSGNFTIECWVKIATYTNWSRVIDFGNGAGSNNVLLGTSVGTSGKPGFYVGGSQFQANDQIPLNQWTHLAATLSGNTATIYINGVASGTATFPIPANVTRNSNYIGRSNWGWGDPAPNASFDDLRIWNVAKTGAEIQASMNNELVGNESGLVAYFKFNEGVSCGNNTAITTLVNSATATGSSYNATLSGFTLNGTCVSNFVDGKVNLNSGLTSVPTVTSAGGRIWMDRNLGATQVAISVTDASAYGDLYQWGRGNDNHQLRTSGNTTTQSVTDTPGNNLFIYGSTDWRSTSNVNLWQGITGTNNPCPTGFRLPTKVEWETEIASWSIQSKDGAFASPLKLPTPGFRHYPNGSVMNEGLNGDYWSSTVDGVNSFIMYIHVGAGTVAFPRAYGFTCRCIKD
ncbi:MAG: hypothetical protein RL308_2225 [Bacteroidota bacterium]|jgi:uncharacterized protein (TIGR02145 family)